MNRVELAKSSRSSCKLCKEKIEKTNPRVGIEKEITMSGKTFTSMGWHHVDCIIDKMPDELITIEFGENIPDEIIQKINKEIEKLNKSNFSIKVFTDILEENQIINVKGTVLRALKPSEQELPDGNVKEARTIWVEDSENKKRGKFILWGTHSTTNPTSGDIILLLNGLSVLAENDEIQYHATDKSTILINPSDDDMQNNVIEVKYYTSKAWDRPDKSFVTFEIAKSSRASCLVCNNKITKGEIKIAKPMWIELEDQNRNIPGARSLHTLCSINDENSDELLHEGISRLDPTFISENRGIFEELNDRLPDSLGKQLLNKFLF